MYTQIIPIHEEFSPSNIEISKAKEIIKGFDLAVANGTGVFELDGKMIDAPVVERAKQTIKLAIACGLVFWRITIDETQNGKKCRRANGSDRD